MVEISLNLTMPAVDGFKTGRYSVNRTKGGFAYLDVFAVVQNSVIVSGAVIL